MQCTMNCQFINQTTKRNRNEARKDKLERGVNLFAIEMILTIIRNRNEARKDKLERGVNLFFKVLCDKHNNL